MCPPPLFADIVRINHLRMRATEQINEPAGAETLSEEAYELLGRIRRFSSNDWAQSKTSSKQEWILIGNVYQAAVALYCLSSLQSLSVLPAITSLQSQYAVHGQFLRTLLAEGLTSPKIKRYMLWPLVVLGVVAVHDHEGGGGAMRAFVAEQLPALSRDGGTYVPFTAKGVLDAFWASGKTGWDACFDRPYAFTMQIAADTSRIYQS